RAKTALPLHPTFHTPRPAPPAAAPAAPASSNTRRDRGDQTPHTARDTTGVPGESATDRSSCAAGAAGVDRADHRRPRPLTRRLPASQAADGEEHLTPGSGPRSPPAPGPRVANPFLPQRPTPEPHPI